MCRSADVCHLSCDGYMGCANYRFASKSYLSNVDMIPVSSLSKGERELMGPFYYASATEPFSDTIDAHLRAHRVLVATGRPRNPDGANNILTGLDRQRPLCRGDLIEVQGASPGRRGR